MQQTNSPSHQVGSELSYSSMPSASAPWPRTWSFFSTRRSLIAVSVFERDAPVRFHAGAVGGPVRPQDPGREEEEEAGGEAGAHPGLGRRLGVAREKADPHGATSASFWFLMSAPRR